MHLLADLLFTYMYACWYKRNDRHSYFSLLLALSQVLVDLITKSVAPSAIAAANQSKKLTAIENHGMYHNCYYYIYSQTDYNIVIKALKELLIVQ